MNFEKPKTLTAEELDKYVDIIDKGLPYTRTAIIREALTALDKGDEETAFHTIIINMGVWSNEHMPDKNEDCVKAVFEFLNRQRKG